MIRTPVILSAITPVIVSLCLALGAGASAQAQDKPAEPKVKATHGAWTVRCAPAEGQEICIMSQVGKDGSGNQVAEMQIRRLEGAKTQDGKPVAGAMQVVTPLGVVLTQGLKLKVDSKKERGAPYELCTQQGCVVRQPVDETFINEMKGGNNAVLTMVAAPNRTVTTTLSLSGFTKAYDEIK